LHVLMWARSNSCTWDDYTKTLATKKWPAFFKI
jgi:hypothetical protein